MAIGLVIGIFPLYHLMFTYGSGGTSGPGLKLIAFAVPLVLIGLWLFIDIFRRSHYLLIKTDSGMRRIPLENCIPSEVIIAASNMGYPVDSKPLE